MAVDMAILLRIAAILFPIVAIVLVGFFYGRRHDPEMGVANRINMDIFVPALILGAMASKSFEPERYLGLATGAAAMLLCCGLVAWPVARALKLDWRTFVPPMMFNNSANIGIPLAVLTWGEAALPAAVILYSVSNVLHFSIGVHMLDSKASWMTLWRNPTLLSAALGISIALLGIPVWEPIVTALQLLGNVAIPLLLFALGVRMRHVRFNDLSAPLVGAFIRPLLGMGIAWLFASLLQLSPQDSAMLLVFGALPPAVMNFLFAERYHQDPARVAAIVLIGNLAAILVLPIALTIVLS
ncbi:AEC family transporter [Parahaliea sp. F7430]|uniref:AEC family transporter n=1 Tax=Sediminihaliea albiluteola TaxID=2758564 RepID=A0A7W2TTX8_9GAMM|nr:AEC family transporter [Sediminihaliea albiluteola]MBA6411823.1 AEC family transporter [Sediminihaliea albiluteola]